MTRFIWTIVALALTGSTYFAYEAGFLMYLWEADLSKLSFVIMAILLHGMYRLMRVITTEKHIIESDLDPGFEAANMCMSIGMLGTVIGFISMTMAFHGVDISEIQNVKDLFSIATGGMSTALLTTATGLVSSLILRTLHYVAAREFDV